MMNKVKLTIILVAALTFSCATMSRTNDKELVVMCKSWCGIDTNMLVYYDQNSVLCNCSKNKKVRFIKGDK